MKQSQIERDAQYRVVALKLAVTRASSDGDVLALADIYYNWLTGEDDGEPQPEGEL